MNLYRDLNQRLEQQGPVGIGLIGCGKFASMFLAQARLTAGFRIVAIADLAPDRARANLARCGWTTDDINAVSFVDSASGLFEQPGLDVMIEATGDAVAGLFHATAAIDAGLHVIMVNVEADVLAGPALSQRAAAKGVVYSQAYGDQPALIAEMIDWARLCGFPIVAAGKGTKHMPEFHYATPDNVWDRYGITAADAEAAGMNPKMFNSFLDGTKSAIEMAAVANASGLAVPRDGLLFPPARTDQLAQVMADHPARQEGGFTEVVSCLDSDGQPLPNDLRWGVYVAFAAPSDYVRACFRDYGLVTDRSGAITALYRPYHLIGLELGVSVARAALNGEPTGCTATMRGDVIATAKRDLEPGETLDGEGGYCVYGRLQPARASREAGLLPIGLASDVRVRRRIGRGDMLTFDDVDGAYHEGIMAMRQQAMEGAA